MAGVLPPNNGGQKGLGGSQGPTQFQSLQKCVIKGFPGGSVVKNLPANAGDSGLTLWVGRIP